jgi:hypothetical protein
MEASVVERVAAHFRIQHLALRALAVALATAVVVRAWAARSL